MRTWLVLLGLMLSFHAFAVEEFNPYAKSYVSRMTAPTGTAEKPRLFAGSDKVTDYYRLLEDGYDMLGYSSFETGDVPPDEALQQAADVHATLVLVYNTGVDHVANRQNRKADDAESKPDGTIYQYFATYWAKLPTPLLGLHVQRERPDDDAGLEVMAVIKNSPAAESGLLRGDVLTKIGDVELHRPEQLSQAAQRYSGQSVDVVWRRGENEFRKSVTLNRR